MEIGLGTGKEDVSATPAGEPAWLSLRGKGIGMFLKDSVQEPVKKRRSEK